MNELSLFIDESGHFNSSKQGYYLLTLVLHEQRHEVTRQIEILESSLVNLGLSAQHVFHSGAAIRGEESYRGLDVSFRRAVFTKFVAFAGKLPGA